MPIVRALAITLTACLLTLVAQQLHTQPPATGPTTCVLVNLTIKPDVDRAQVMKVMPDEVRATVKLYLPLSKGNLDNLEFIPMGPERCKNKIRPQRGTHESRRQADRGAERRSHWLPTQATVAPVTAAGDGGPGLGADGDRYSER